MKQKIFRIIIRIGIVCVILTVSCFGAAYNAYKEYDVVITNISVDSSNIEEYIIKTRLLSGEEKIFTIDNNALKEIETSNKESKLDVGKKYHFKVIGLDMFKKYERIIDLKKVS